MAHEARAGQPTDRSEARQPADRIEARQPADRIEARQPADRIEALLDEVRSMVTPPAWGRVEALVRSVLELHREGLAQALSLLAKDGADAATARLCEDPLVGALLLIHDLHPDDLESRVHKALARVRPYLDSHGGDVALIGIDAAGGAVRLEMKGSCDGCPSSALTVKLAVEGAIRDLAPEIERIEVENVTPAAPAPASRWVRIETPAAAAGALEVRELDGVSLIFCRVDERLYAYRDACPACDGALGGGSLTDGVLACPGCAQCYDVRRAGRAQGDGAPQLGPVPLLEEATGTEIALDERAA